MEYFNFEYFCGANVLVRVGDMPLLEASGLSLHTQETKRPIYGYSSRFFDAVARGQVLVQGQLAINYVHQDYLYYAIRAGLNLIEENVSTTSIPQPAIQDYMQSLGLNDELDGQFIQSMKNQFWAPQSSKRGYHTLKDTRNPHDDGAGVNFRVTFGDQDLGLKDSGKTGMLISNVHFLGRSSVINVDENAIIELYPFIARNVYSLQVMNYTETTILEDSTDPTNVNFGESLLFTSN